MKKDIQFLPYLFCNIEIITLLTFVLVIKECLIKYLSIQ